MLKGKRISILGDSISTYRGASNNADACSSTYVNPYHYKEPFPIEKTYWMQIINRFGMTLCVNNSWSGGNLSGKNDETSGLNRANRLADNNGEQPDFIILFMGTNDLGRAVNPDVFSNDYASTLEIIGKNYPDATVCCVNIPDRDTYLKPRAEIFNQIIDSAVKAAGESFFVADLYHSRLNNDFYYLNTTDGLHPDEDGMTIIAEIVEEAIKQQLKT